MVTTNNDLPNAPAPVASVDPANVVAGQAKQKLLSGDQARDDYDILEDPARTPKHGFKPDPDALPSTPTAGQLPGSIAERDALYEAQHRDPDSYRARVDLDIAASEAELSGVDSITRGAHSGATGHLNARSKEDIRELLRLEGERQQRDPSRSSTAHIDRR